MNLFDNESSAYKEILAWTEAKATREPFEVLAMDATQKEEVCQTQFVFSDNDIAEVLENASRYLSPYAMIDPVIVRAILMSAIEVQQLQKNNT